MTALERYALILLLIGSVLGGAYLEGVATGREQVLVANEKAHTQALQDMATAATARAGADNAARIVTENFIEQMRRSAQDVRNRFAALPQVVVDPGGCQRLSDGFRMRYEADSRVLGPADPAAGSVADAVPTATGVIAGPIQRP